MKRSSKNILHNLINSIFVSSLALMVSCTFLNNFYTGSDTYSRLRKYKDFYYIPNGDKDNYDFMSKYLIKKYSCVFQGYSESQVSNFLREDFNKNSKIPKTKGYIAIPEYDECPKK